MQVDILRGSTRDVLQEINPSVVYIPTTNNYHLLEMIHSVEKIFPVKMVEDEPFVNLKKPMQYRRFFSYWNKVETAASLQQGGQNA
jgi:ERCC4-type nuclease